MSKARLGFELSNETKRKISLSHKGKKLTEEHKLKLREAKLGKKMSETTKEKHRQHSHSLATRKKMSESHKGERSYNWKGDKVGYYGLHSWVSKNLGKPDKCEHCGKDGLFGKKIHWANKSGKYFRELGDWIRLCVVCHSAYDKKLKT